MSSTPQILDAQIVASAARAADFPSGGVPEVAFLGRSNVGKSSLLNRAVGRKKLARTSNTPGKTRLIHFFQVKRRDDSLLLVDLPGYGYAKVSQQERRAWKQLVEGYLQERAPLRAAVLLQDLRRDASDEELDLLAWLAEREIPTALAFTKCDKLAPMRRAQRVRTLAEQFAEAKAEVIACSALRNIGMDALWAFIDAQLDG